MLAFPDRQKLSPQEIDEQSVDQLRSFVKNTKPLARSVDGGGRQAGGSIGQADSYLLLVVGRFGISIR